MLLENLFCCKQPVKSWREIVTKGLGNSQPWSRLVTRKESYVGSNAGDSGPFDVSGKHILIMHSWILPGCKQFPWWPIVPGNILHATVVSRILESLLKTVVAQYAPSLHVSTVILREKGQFAIERKRLEPVAFPIIIDKVEELFYILRCVAESQWRQQP